MKTKYIILACLAMLIALGCKKEKETEAPVNNNPSNTVTDVDGNVYHTVVIGTQTWMVENLITTKFNDGMNIQNITDSFAWMNATQSAYCWYYNDKTNYEQYGALYNSYAIHSTKLCPNGWHVPTYDDWNKLILFIDTGANFANQYVSLTAGGLLKETGIVHWYTPNGGATNQFGFTALPGGYRFNGSFKENGFFGYLSVFGQLPYSAFYRMNNNNAYLDRVGFSFLPSVGLCVRCLQDSI